tara:strand:+ start:1301 stop:1540 length:240 start_codon:yes stop_codon:yes gene_type:complete
MDDKNKIESPCTGNCRYDSTFQYCLGCWRDASDITGWVFLSNSKKIMALRRRKANKIKHLRLFAERRLNANTENNRNDE